LCGFVFTQHRLLSVSSRSERIARQKIATAIAKIDAELEPLEEQHRNLRRLALNGTFDDQEYRDSKEELVLAQNRLKQEKRRLQKSHENYWVEPARKLVSTLETLGKTPTPELLPEISGVVQKIGTNHLISRKTVSFSLSKDYDFLPSLLVSARAVTSHQSSTSNGESSQCIKWCARQDLNLHALRHYHLKVARLPIPPRAHGTRIMNQSLGIRASQFGPASRASLFGFSLAVTSFVGCGL
jgi:hypothetical protein